MDYRVLLTHQQDALKDVTFGIGEYIDENTGAIETSGLGIERVYDYISKGLANYLTIDCANKPYITIAYYTEDKTFLYARKYDTSSLDNLEIELYRNAYYFRLNFYYILADENNLVIARKTDAIYSDEVAKEYAQESDQIFFRASLNGKFKFVLDDFDFIMNTEFDEKMYFILQESEDYKNEFTEYFKGSFMRTDCTINVDDKIIEVTPSVEDDYTDILANQDKEFNIVNLAPKITKINLYKRPVIQLYELGTNVVSNILGGSNWEQDADTISDSDALINTYYFSLCSVIAQAKVEDSEGVDKGTFEGKLTVDNTNKKAEARLYAENGTDYLGIAIDYSIRTKVIMVIILSINSIKYVNEDIAEYDNFQSLTGDETLYNANDPSDYVYIHNLIKPIFGRLMCDVDTLSGLTTYDIPEDDIVENTNNYSKVIGYAIDGVYMSTTYSTTPTSYGIYKDGQYYTPPYSLGTTFYPVMRSSWTDISLWFDYELYASMIENNGRKKYQLKYTYDLSSCISVLLKQIAPDITHEALTEYSEFLYSSFNPISYDRFRLYISQKTNFLTSELDKPATKANITLQDITNMLRDCFRCYWYIEDKKFKIEHISFFMNGGSYSYIAENGIDLTTMINSRNGKKWAYLSSTYKFDKLEMAAQYTFAFMDDTTTLFNGIPIDIQSNYVTASKTEDVNISQFTTDLDYMLISPEEISNDGFVMFAANPSSTETDTADIIFKEVDSGGASYDLQNGLLSFTYLAKKFYTYDLPSREATMGGDDLYVYGIKRLKLQEVKFPLLGDINLLQLVKTNIGSGEIQKLSVNLQSRQATATLKYDTK